MEDFAIHPLRFETTPLRLEAVGLMVAISPCGGLRDASNRIHEVVHALGVLDPAALEEERVEGSLAFVGRPGRSLYLVVTLMAFSSPLRLESFANSGRLPRSKLPVALARANGSCFGPIPGTSARS